MWRRSGAAEGGEGRSMGRMVGIEGSGSLKGKKKKKKKTRKVENEEKLSSNFEQAIQLPSLLSPKSFPSSFPSPPLLVSVSCPSPLTVEIVLRSFPHVPSPSGDRW